MHKVELAPDEAPGVEAAQHVSHVAGAYLRSDFRSGAAGMRAHKSKGGLL